MSHFMVGVIVPGNSCSDYVTAKYHVAQLLAPYNEDIRVAPYKRYHEASFLERIAERQGFEKGDFQTICNYLNDTLPPLPEMYHITGLGSLERLNDAGIEVSESILKDFPAFCALYNDFLVANHSEGVKGHWFLFYDENGLYKYKSFAEDTSLSEYSFFDEKGVYEYTCYNTKSKWDWWVIGGRWNGVVRNAARSDGFGNYGDEFHKVSENHILVKDLDLTKPEELHFFALVTPDGVWHEKGEMGWWGIVSSEQTEEAWQKEVLDILQKNQDAAIIGVDCHI